MCALFASYQLFFHLNTLARDVVDQVALAAGRGGALRVPQRLHTWAWLLKGPAAPLLFNAARLRAHVTTLYEWMLAAALNTGEYLLAALLPAWAVLAVMQIAALLTGFALARRGKRETAAPLATARIGMVVSTALFALLSVVLWSVVAYVSGLALKDLLFEPPCSAAVIVRRRSFSRRWCRT